MKNMIKKESIQGMLRNEIVEKSVEILRRHGKKDGEIRKMMLYNFSVSETALNAILEGKHTGASD